MLTLDNHPTGRHFLQIPGPSPVPDRILRAMSLPTIDHRGPEFGQLGLQALQLVGCIGRHGGFDFFRGCVLQGVGVLFRHG